ncbi:MAG: hypothetical protein LUH58_01875 [Lachnospiraceae bacterium]|nr:hypothetical protein [Lachnospiraceae bacterium]
MDGITRDRNGIRKFQISRSLMQEELAAELLVLPMGVEVCLYGGSLPHIGAVSIVDPDGNMTTTQFPGHRDGVVSAGWAKTIADEGFLPVSAVVGIHYDNLTKEEIEAVVAATDEMLKEALERIKAGV